MSGAKYHYVDCCDATIGADALFAQYKDDRDHIVTLMNSNPEQLIKTMGTSESPIPIDNECRCRMGTGEIRTAFACAQCKSLRRLTDFKLGAINHPIKIDYGDHMGTTIIVNPVPSCILGLSWFPEISAQIQRTCSVSLRCLGGDPFTMRAFITWQLQSEFESLYLPHILPLYSAFVCKESGYYVSSVPTIGTLQDLHRNSDYHAVDLTQNSLTGKYFGHIPLMKEVVRSIILQILVILQVLSMFNFSGGNFNTEDIVFTHDPVSYRYEGVRIEGSLTVQIKPSSNASSTLNGVRFFTRTAADTLVFEKNMFLPGITFNDAGLYSLSRETADTFAIMRKFGCPLQNDSHNFYSIMLSLMKDMSFRLAILETPALYALWSQMWLPEDLSKINLDTGDMYGLWLHPDVVHRTWEYMAHTEI